MHVKQIVTSKSLHKREITIPHGCAVILAKKKKTGIPNDSN